MLQGVKMQDDFRQAKMRCVRLLRTGAFAFVWIAAGMGSVYGQTPGAASAADKPITL
jgi:hypothetical protein